MKTIRYYGSEVRGRTATADPARGSFLVPEKKGRRGPTRVGKTARKRGGSRV